MRRLDLIGMILTIIGGSIILPAIITFAFFFGINLPVPFLRALYRAIIIGAITIGALIFIIGIIIRIVDRVQEKKESIYLIEHEKTENEIVDDFIDYLKKNEGKAFSINALLNRIYQENQIEINRNKIEELLQILVKKNELKYVLKDGENFYLYEYNY
ncbi:MAG: hypothetical protein ACFFCY_00395 [Promethearchaeota archaeon]